MTIEFLRAPHPLVANLTVFGTTVKAPDTWIVMRADMRDIRDIRRWLTMTHPLNLLLCLNKEGYTNEAFTVDDLLALLRHLVV